MPRPRFSLRTQLIAVAIVAVVLGVVVNLRARRDRFAALAAYYGKQLRDRSATRTLGDVGPVLVPSSREASEEFLGASALAEKYERAARRPWLPVLPDPEEGRVVPSRVRRAGE